jgi:RNA polymerase sigma-70 factor (ECF subfamily)
VRTDAELVNACLDGEKTAFAALVKRYERPVRAISLAVCRDYHSAADISQDAFVTAYQNLSGLRKGSAFGPWLMKITHRCALDFIRRRQKETPLEKTGVCGIENPGGRLDEDQQKLLAAVVRLPKAEKQVIMLRYFAGHGVKDVAEILSRSVGTVTKQLSRAHKRLRNMLKEA